MRITPEMIIPGITRIESYWTGRTHLVEAVEADTDNLIRRPVVGDLVPAVKLTLRVEGHLVKGSMIERVPADAVIRLAASEAAAKCLPPSPAPKR